jgi:hypothetical protein
MASERRSTVVALVIIGVEGRRCCGRLAAGEESGEEWQLLL